MRLCNKWCCGREGQREGGKTANDMALVAKVAWQNRCVYASNAEITLKQPRYDLAAVGYVPAYRQGALHTAPLRIHITKIFQVQVIWPGSFHRFFARRSGQQARQAAPVCSAAVARRARIIQRAEEDNVKGHTGFFLDRQKCLCYLGQQKRSYAIATFMHHRALSLRDTCTLFQSRNCRQPRGCASFFVEWTFCIWLRSLQFQSQAHAETRQVGRA
jgi:hypothetical protein